MMMILRSIAPAIILKESRKKTTLQVFLRSFYLASLTFGYLWNSFSAAYAANDNSEKENTQYSRVIAVIAVIGGFTCKRGERVNSALY